MIAFYITMQKCNKHIVHSIMTLYTIFMIHYVNNSQYFKIVFCKKLMPKVERRFRSIMCNMYLSRSNVVASTEKLKQLWVLCQHDVPSPLFGNYYQLITHNVMLKVLNKKVGTDFVWIGFGDTPKYILWSIEI